MIAKTNNRGMLAMLVRRNAYLNAVDQLNRTPLYIAAQKNHVDVALVSHLKDKRKW